LDWTRQRIENELPGIIRGEVVQIIQQQMAGAHEALAGLEQLTNQRFAQLGLQ
jgi:hypothetical protein